MIVGIDFDNTLACYDGIFHAEALRRGLLEPDAPKDKRGVRAALCAKGREEDFTILQGYVYGPGITAAPAYPGALDCIRRLLHMGAEVFVVSHKTPYPYLGPRYDLQESARQWLVARGFVAPDALEERRIFLESTKEAKLARIAELGCTHFIDDLPDFLAHPLFPAGCKGLLFAPPAEDGRPGPQAPFPAFANWEHLDAWLTSALAQEGASS